MNRIGSFACLSIATVILGLGLIGRVAALADGPTSAPAAGWTGGAKNVVVVYDGETHNTGWAWTHHICSLEPTDQDSHTPTHSLKFHGEENEWVGGGWHWFQGPNNPGGTDVTNMTTFSFWIKVTGSGIPKDVDVHLRGIQTNGSGMSNLLSILPYCPNALDGQWHQVVIPLKDFTGAGFDKTTTREFDIEATGHMKFDAFIDDLTFDDR
jgi:hypothetical protein